MGYCPLVDFHSFPLTKQFPITPRAIQLIGTPSTFCIEKTVPGFLDVIPFLSLDIAIFVVLHLNEGPFQEGSNTVCMVHKIKGLYFWKKKQYECWFLQYSFHQFQLVSFSISACLLCIYIILYMPCINQKVSQVKQACNAPIAELSCQGT